MKTMETSDVLEVDKRVRKQSKTDQKKRTKKRKRRNRILLRNGTKTAFAVGVFFFMYLQTVIFHMHTKPKNETNVSQPPILIVGGSDGSGTRAVVDLLRELGTVVISEDPVTSDVHASEIKGGWPGLVHQMYEPFGEGGIFALDASNSKDTSSSVGSNSSIPVNKGKLVPNFNWPPMRTGTYPKYYKKAIANVEANVLKLFSSWMRRYNLVRRTPGIGNIRIKTSHRIRIGAQKQNRNPYDRGARRNSKLFPNAIARATSFAVKAPVSMLALPIIAKCYDSVRETEEPIKFLHVIRDGRDVAMSDNQSPVVKFFNLTYPETFRDEKNYRFEELPGLPMKTQVVYAKAMQLWNDWNVMVHRWATRHNVGRSEGRPLVEYLWIRSEDLLVPGSSERYDALKAMANFVGSSLTPEELCCLSRRETKDHGQSHLTGTTARRKKSGRRLAMEETQEIRRKPASNVSATVTNDEFLESYTKWKSAVDIALLPKNHKKAKFETLEILIQKGSMLIETRLEFLHSSKVDALTSIETTKELPSKQEIVDSVEKLKLRLGQSRSAFRTAMISVADPKTDESVDAHHSVKKRYGKWQTVLAESKTLSEFFHREGAEGLRVFGYEPRRQMQYPAPVLGREKTRNLDGVIGDMGSKIESFAVMTEKHGCNESVQCL